jgi:HEAT repeat protein
MAARRKAISSPVFYAALLACGLVGLYYVVELGGPEVGRRFQKWTLRRALLSPDAQSRLGGVRAMEPQTPALTNDLLVEAASDPDMEVRLAACRILASRQTQHPLVVSVLSKAVEDPREKVRIDAAHIAGLIIAAEAYHEKSTSAAPESSQVPEATAILCRVLKDSQVDVRSTAAEQLGRGGLGPAPDELVAAASDPDRGVRRAVANSLLRRNGPADPTAARLICALIADPKPVADRFEIMKLAQETSSENRERAVQALAGLIPKADVGVLPDVIACLGQYAPQSPAALKVLDRLLDDSELSTRASAAMAILAVDDKPTPRLMVVLAQILTGKELPQDWRMDALGRLKETNPKALSTATQELVRQLGDKSPDVRHAALDLLSAVIDESPAEMPGPHGGK